MNLCYEYSIKWRYEFHNNSHYKYKISHYKYKNLGAMKNYIGSFSSNVKDNILIKPEKGRYDFNASGFDHRKVNLFA